MAESPDTRTRLLQAAIEVIEADGESAVRIREVSARAGVSYASLYHFFGDRTSLIDAAQVERFSQSLWVLVEELAARVLACGSAEEFLELCRRMLEQLLVPERSVFRWTRVSVLGSARNRPELVPRLGQALQDSDRRVAAALRPAQERGWIPAELDLEAFSAWVHGVVTARLFIEVRGDLVDGTAWNRMAIDGVLAVLTGAAPATA